MRFEHVLQIYWTKGFFFGGKLFYFNKTFDSIFENTPGLNLRFKELIMDRFELKNHVSTKVTLIDAIELKKNISVIEPLNIIFSQVNSVNNSIEDIKKLNILRLYLIKSYRGRCHALGKPVRGQRTWSNAWNSYKVNKTLRSFINETKKKLLKKSKIKNLKKICRNFSKLNINYEITIITNDKSKKEYLLDQIKEKKNSQSKKITVVLI